jgi:uncharacterized protein (UPF0218 family)
MSTASSPSEFDDSFPEGDLTLPEHMRAELAEPMGALVSGRELTGHLKDSRRVISVGDVVTITLLQMNMEPDVAVFDYRTQRSDDNEMKERIAGMSGRLVRVRNPPGMITRELWHAVRSAANAEDRVKIEVSGEEDLAALVAMATGPIGGHVLYGQPQKGLVLVHLDARTRELASEAIRRMAR